MNERLVREAVQRALVRWTAPENRANPSTLEDLVVDELRGIIE